MERRPFEFYPSRLFGNAWPGCALKVFNRRGCYISVSNTMLTRNKRKEQEPWGRRRVQLIDSWGFVINPLFNLQREIASQEESK
jgi:hypothetical protein